MNITAGLDSVAVTAASSTATVAAGRNTTPTATEISAATQTITAEPCQPSATRLTMSRPKPVANAGAPTRVSALAPSSTKPPPHSPAAIRHHTHGLLQTAVARPRHDVHTDGGHVAIHGGALQRPHSIHQRILLVFERRTIENVD